MSLPMRERELKRKASAGLHPGARSLPMRERELKPAGDRRGRNQDGRSPCGSVN